MASEGLQEKKTLLWDFWLLESNKLLRKVLVGCSSHASPGPFNVSRDVSPNPIKKQKIKNFPEAHADDARQPPGWGFCETISLALGCKPPSRPYNSM